MSCLSNNTHSNSFKAIYYIVDSHATAGPSWYNNIPILSILLLSGIETQVHRSSLRSYPIFI